QSVLTNDVPAEQQKANFVADKRHGGNDVRANSDGPESELIPRKEEAGVAQKQRHQEKDYADDPVEFMRWLITTPVENVEQWPKNGEGHEGGGQPVEIAEEDAIGDDELEVFHVAISGGRRGMVVEHQQNAGH